MEKSIFEQMGGTYRQEGDYLLPNLVVPEISSVGIWGQQHLRYIKERRKAFYTSLQLSGKLNDYLADIDQQAMDMFFQLVNKMIEQEGITEQLKSDEPMEWVGKMNNIRERVIELVNANLIYT